MATFHVPRDPLNPHQLIWEEVDPRRHPFDRESVLRLVGGFAPASQVPPARGRDTKRPEWRNWSADSGDAWTGDMAQAIVDHYGVWACGWQWGRGESDWDGGPVTSWCCAGHSIKAPEETLRSVADALVEWRDWLETLARAFDSYLPMPTGGDDKSFDRWERAATNLMTLVLVQTGGMSAWYGHCDQVLSWFVSVSGVDADHARNLVEQATDGRFESWTSTLSEYPGIGRHLGELVARDRDG